METHTPHTFGTTVEGRRVRLVGVSSLEDIALVTDGKGPRVTVPPQGTTPDSPKGAVPYHTTPREWKDMAVDHLHTPPG